VGVPSDRSALEIAVVYALLGLLWTTVSNALIARLFTNTNRILRLQVLKGGVFVAISAAAVYFLTARSFESLRESKADLERSTKQSQILRRVLRHNVCNATNVVHGRAEMIVEEADDPQAREHAEAVLETAEDLLQLTEETRILRRVMQDSDRPNRPVDVDRLVRGCVDDLADDYPTATITTELDGETRALADEYVDIAVENIVEIPLKYARSPAPSVHVATKSEGDDVVLRVVGDEAVVPETERTALEETPESPISHAEGLGLRVAQTVVTQSDGDLTVVGEDESAAADGIDGTVAESADNTVVRAAFPQV
jgi:light-regulated signal transduction histidine kinase (bacteriophytochrome)